MGTRTPNTIVIWMAIFSLCLGSGLAFAVDEGITSEELSAQLSNSVTSTTKAVASSPASVTSSKSSTDDIFQAVKNAMGESPNETGSTQSDLFQNSNGESTTEYVGRMLMSLAFVILLALSLAWAMKRFLLKNRTLGGGHIQLLTSYNLSQKSRVHLLQVGEEFLLVGEGGNSLSLISRVNLSRQKQENHSLDEMEEEEESIPQPITNTEDFTPFQDRLSKWQNSLDDQNLNQEVKASLLLLGGLSQRLRRKGGDGNA